MLNTNVKKTRVGVIRNMIFFLLSWFCIFSAFGALELLQSSLNTKNGLGVYSISILYGMKAFSSLFGPVIVTSLTPKWTLFIGYLCHSVFILCNYYPKWFTMIPASIVLGLVTGPLWICCGVYTTVLGIYYSGVTSHSKDAVLSKFNGIQGFVISLSVIAGNSVSSSVLKYVTFDDVSTQNTLHSYHEPACNSTDQFTTELVSVNETESPISQGYLCGTMYCPRDHLKSDTPPDTNKPDQRTVYILLTALGIFNICGVIFLLFGLQNIPARDIMSEEIINSKQSGCRKLLRYIKLFFNWKYLLLIPSIGYLYIVQPINNSTFTRAYVTCSVGMDMIGFLAMTSGLAMVIMNYISGLLGQYMHRNYLFLMGFIALLGVYGIMLLWDAISNTVLLFAASALFGCASGLNMPQFSAFLGAAFTSTKTEAFSFYQFISGIVACLGYAMTNNMCVRNQIYTALATMGFAMVTYTILSIHLYQKQREELDDAAGNDYDFESNAAMEMEVMINRAMAADQKKTHFKLRSKSLDIDGQHHHATPGLRYVSQSKVAQFSDIQQSQHNAF